jgi:hypothetical protein
VITEFRFRTRPQIGPRGREANSFLAEGQLFLSANLSERLSHSSEGLSFILYTHLAFIATFIQIYFYNLDDEGKGGER